MVGPLSLVLLILLREKPLGRLRAGLILAGWPQPSVDSTAPTPCAPPAIRALGHTRPTGWCTRSSARLIGLFGLSYRLINLHASPPDSAAASLHAQSAIAEAGRETPTRQHSHQAKANRTWIASSFLSLAMARVVRVTKHHPSPTRQMRADGGRTWMSQGLRSQERKETDDGGDDGGTRRTGK